MSDSIRFRLWVGPFLAALVPLGWLVWLLVRYHVDVPCDFQLSQAFLLEKSYSGQLSLADIWQQQAMHRGFFPRLATLWIARMTRWDLSWEAAANVAMAGGVLWALLRCLVRVIRVTGDARMRWHARMEPAREALRAGTQDEELLSRLNPNHSPVLKKAIPILKRHHLSVFREPA